MSQVRDIFKELMKSIFVPKSFTKEDYEDITTQQIKALAQKRSIGSLLMYRYYEEYSTNSSDKRGIYTMCDGRRGIILQVFPPPYVGENYYNVMKNFFESITDYYDDTVIHINSFASKNIDTTINNYITLHSNDDINIKEKKFIKFFFQNRAKEMRNFRYNSISKNADIRVRNFSNTISMLFAQNTPIEKIKSFYAQLMGLLHELQPINFSADKLIAQISEVLKPDLGHWDIYNDKMMAINTQMARGTSAKLSENSGEIELSTDANTKPYIVKTLTTVKFPKQVDIFDYHSAFCDPFGNVSVTIPCSYMVSLVIHFKDAKKRAKNVLSKARWNQDELSKLELKTIKNNPILKDKKDEFESIVNTLTTTSEKPIEAMWTLYLYDDNKSKLDEYTSLIKTRFLNLENGGWEIEEEKFSTTSMMSLLYSFPLQFSPYIKEHLQRFNVLFKSNNASITPLISDMKGYGKPMLLFIGRSGQLQTLDFMASDSNYNGVIVGPPGTGKSYLINEILLSYLGAGFIIRHLEDGRSVKRVVNAIGGKHLEFDNNNNICLNFFTKIKTEVKSINSIEKEIIIEDEYNTIVPIIGFMMGIKLVSNYDKDVKIEDMLIKTIATFIEQAITIAFERENRNAGMQTVYEVLVEISDKLEDSEENLDIRKLLINMIFNLKDYVIYTDNYGGLKKGKNYEYFNGVSNLEFDNNFFAGELKELMNKGDLKYVATMMIMHLIATEFLTFSNNRGKIVSLDDLKELLENSIFASFYDVFSRRIRKYNGICLIATQYMSDFACNRESRAIFDGATFKMIMAHNKSNVDRAVNIDKMLVLDEAQLELLKSLKKSDGNYSEMFILYQDKINISRLKVDTISHYLYTTKKDDYAIINDLVDRYSIDTTTACVAISKIISGEREDIAIKYAIDKLNKGDSYVI